MTVITLTADQQAAYEAFTKFILDPYDTVFVLSGFSGTGKTTLVKTLLEKLPSINKTAQLLGAQANQKELTTVLTATTNKAAEAFSNITKENVCTIHSFLELRVENDFKSGESRLVQRKKGAPPKEGFLIFIDEASYIDAQLLAYIFRLTKNCKIVFMGDPAQLTPVKSSNTPVFTSGFHGAHLSQVVRQAEGNPIVDLSTKFRLTVSSGEFFSFKPDGIAIKHMNRSDFEDEILKEVKSPNWHHDTSKVLAWTNKTVIAYNNAIRDHVQGDPELAEGDYAICNKYISKNGTSIKTDAMVYINMIGPTVVEYGVEGNYYNVDYAATAFFMPKHLKDKKALLKQAKEQEDFSLVAEVENSWIDLRAAYACTVNKAQGSTYDKVFIDLDDISRCNSANQIARMLYVGVSRARHEVVFTGDFV